MQALAKVTEVNSNLRLLKTSPGFTGYMDSLIGMKEDIKDNFGRIKGDSVEQVGMRCLVLQAQLGLIQSIINFTEEGYAVPEQTEIPS